MKNMIWNDKAIFTSVIMSRRHAEIGTVEDSDYGTIQIIHLPLEEKQLIVEFKDNNKFHEFIEYKGLAYSKMQEVSRISRADSEKLMKRQGRFTEKQAIGVALAVRSQMENSFSYPGSLEMILIGGTLYANPNPISDIRVTTCGNLMFSYWLSVDIEYNNPNKCSYPLHKSSFDAVVKDCRKTFNAGKPKPDATKTGMDGHVYFSTPKSVKWGAAYAH